MEKGPGLAALVGHGWRLASLAGLRLGALYSRFDPNVPQFSRNYPPV